jgi:hypothetical protein
MYYCMAVGAYWPQVGNGIHIVIFADLRQRLEVVNVDESICELAIPCAEVEAAHRTGRSIVSDTASASDCVTLIGVDDDLANRSLNQAVGPRHFFGQTSYLQWNQTGNAHLLWSLWQTPKTLKKVGWKRESL